MISYSDEIFAVSNFVLPFQKIFLLWSWLVVNPPTGSSLVFNSTGLGLSSDTSLMLQAQPAPPQPSLPLSSNSFKGFPPHGTRTVLSSYVNASKLSSRRTEQHRWKKHESRARNACKITAHKHLFLQTEAGEETEITCPPGSSSRIISKAGDALVQIPDSSTGSLTCFQRSIRGSEF